jgi:cyclic-di-GMP phosphodiesterase TipF (flagellum assembly factor)
MFEKMLSPLWFATYAVGSILCVSVMAYAVSITAAVTFAGFLVVFGTLGVEYMARDRGDNKLSSDIQKIETVQTTILNSLQTTEQTIEDLRLRLEQTRQAMPKQNKTANASAFMPSPRNVANQSGLRAQQTAQIQSPAATPQKYADMLARRAPPPMMSSDEIPFEEQTPQFTDSMIRELVQNAVTHDRIEMFAQPIVKLPSRKVHALEVFARIRAKAGVYVPASQYRKLAIEQDLLVEVDRILLHNVLDSVRVNKKRDMSINYFINISTTTLKDFPFMSTLLQFLRSDRDLAPHLIFEFRQSEFATLNEQVKALLKGLARTGCQFSIDNVTQPNLNYADLRDLNVRFVKMDSSDLIKILETDGGTDQIHKLKKRLDAEDMTLIVEKVETERDVRELLDFEIDFGEGYLFGKPNLEIAYRPRKSA